MTVKNLTVFGTFDQTVPTWYVQAAAFHMAVESCLRTLSGVPDLTARAIGKGRLNTGGGIQNVAMASVRVPKPDPFTAAADRARGSSVGLAATSVNLLACIKSYLDTYAGGSDALLGVETSMADAIAQTPPGLIVDTGAQPVSLVFTPLPSPDPFIGLFSVALSADLADAATADAVINLTPIIELEGQFGAIEVASGDPLGFPDPAYLPGSWSFLGTDPITNPGTLGNFSAEFDGNEAGSVVAVTRDAAPYTVNDTFGSLPTTDISRISVTVGAQTTAAAFDCAVGLSDFFNASPDQVLAFGFETTPEVDVGVTAGILNGTLAMLNDTGNLIAGGTVVAQVATFGSAAISS